jgi:hypothetical protein
MSKRMATKRSQLFFVFIALAASYGATASDYIWCTMGDFDHKRVFVSRIFVGDYRNYITYQLAFAKAVDARFSPRVIGSSGCLWKSSESAAKVGMVDQLSTYFSHDDVMQMDWPP